LLRPRALRVESCPPEGPRHTHGYECQSAGCGRFDVNRWGSHPEQPKNGSHELAVVALSTHSGRIKNDRCRLSCLSKIAHSQELGWSCLAQHRLKSEGASPSDDMHSRSSSTRPTRRRSPPRISLDHHAVESNAGSAFQWAVRVRQGLGRDRDAQPVRVAISSALTQARPDMKRASSGGRAC
jgi:hypothetical protein